MDTTLSRKIATGVTLLALLSVGCSRAEAPEGSRRSTGSDGPSAATVEVENIAFQPATLEIAAGTEVVWTNRDEDVRHTATSGTPGEDGVPGVSEPQRPRPDGIFDGDLPDAGAEFRFEFDERGTFDYFCRVHPSMTAQIVVR